MYSVLGFVSSIFVDTAFSWARMFLSLGISVIISIAIGIWAATSRRVEAIVLPIVDILQTLPILAFFPFVIYLVVATLPGYIGINAAVIFLIVTSMVWNIIFGVYESIKTLPSSFIEMSKVYGMGRFDRLTKIYIPASSSRIVGQSILSWSIGLFYLVTSEIFSTGSSVYSVKYGIGVALLNLGLSNNLVNYLIAILIFIGFVVATRFLFFLPLERRFNFNNRGENKRGGIVNAIINNPVPKAFKYVIKSGARNVHFEKPEFLTNPPGSYSTSGISISRSNRIRRLFDRYAYYSAIIILIAMALLLLVTDPTIRSYESLVLISLAASFIRVWFAFIIVLIISIFISIYIVFKSRSISRYILLFQILSSIPATIILPIIIKVFIGFPYHAEVVAFVVFAISGIWYLIFSIIATGRSLPTYINDIVKVFHVSKRDARRKIYIKALMPGIITGGITAIAAEWNASIVAEMFTTTAIGSGQVLTSVKVGIGKLLDISLANGNITLMVIALINLTVMIIIINKFLWRKAYRNTEKIYW